MKDFTAAIFLVSLAAIGACHTRTSIGQLDAGFSTGGHSVLPGTGGNPPGGDSLVPQSGGAPGIGAGEPRNVQLALKFIW